MVFKPCIEGSKRLFEQRGVKERGLMENFNGLSRWYIRKPPDLRTETDKHIAEVEKE